MSYNEADKTHHGVDSRESVKETRLYALPESDLCPVKSLRLYLSKRNPKKQCILPASFDKFWASLWCVVCKCSNGISYTWKYDVNISKAAGLSLTYTNHCVRATTAIVIAHSGVSSLGIMWLTGHRNEKSIQSYVNAPHPPFLRAANIASCDWCGTSTQHDVSSPSITSILLICSCKGRFWEYFA